jgi:transposase-like protein
VFPEVAWQRCHVPFHEEYPTGNTKKKNRKVCERSYVKCLQLRTLKEARERRDEIIHDYMDVAPKGYGITG